MKRIAMLLLALALLTPISALSEEAEVLTLDDDTFAMTILEIGANMDKYEGKTLTMSGYVRLNQGEDAAPFSVARDYVCCGGNDLTPYGFDCAWDGDVPEADSWVTVTGTIGRYVRDNGYPYLLLTLSALEETEPGGRVVTG